MDAASRPPIDLDALTQLACSMPANHGKPLCDLLVAVGAPSAASGGTTMAILTTYRLDDTRFGDLDSRWTRWFAEHYPTTTQENPE